MPGFDIYQIRREAGRTEDGAVLEWFDGCNGTQHASSLNKLYLTDDGRVGRKEPLPTLVKGPCDKTCFGLEKRGGFLLDSEVGSALAHATAQDMVVLTVVSTFGRQHTE